MVAMHKPAMLICISLGPILKTHTQSRRIDPAAKSFESFPSSSCQQFWAELMAAAIFLGDGRALLKSKILTVTSGKKPYNKQDEVGSSVAPEISILT